MPLPFLASWLSRSRPTQAEEIRLALENEVHRQPSVVAANDRRSVLLTAVRSQRAVIAKAGPSEALVGELERRQRVAQQAQAAYEHAVAQAYADVWARYREAVANGQPWDSVLTPIKGFGRARRIEVERQEEQPTPPTTPIPGRVWGTAMKNGRTT